MDWAVNSNVLCDILFFLTSSSMFSYIKLMTYSLNFDFVSPSS